MPRLKLDISMSLDGFIAGPNQNLEQPLGEGGNRLHVVPVLLGDGVRLFGGALPNAPRALERTRVIESPTGVTHVKYQAAS